MVEKKDTLSLRYVLLEGTFNAKKKGHMGMWSGTIENITRTMVWSDPAKPRGKK